MPKKIPAKQRAKKSASSQKTLLPSTKPTKLSERMKTLKTDTEETGPPHLVVIARAGTGKTTTLVEGLRFIKGGATKLVPSQQQAAIWKAMQLGKEQVHTACFVAFNKSIADELKKRVPPGFDAMTTHGLGYRAVSKAFEGIRLSEYRVQDILAEMLSQSPRNLRTNRPTFLQAVETLVGLCKQNLVGPPTYDLEVGTAPDEEEDARVLGELATYYDIDLDGLGKEIFKLVPRVLERCRNVEEDRCIDYNDMVWLPVVLNLPMFRYDLLLVDEAQDLTKGQKALVSRAGKRLILCGDPKQAIYGFAGADSESIPRVIEELKATPRGCEVLYLTYTRRCGKAIVTEAQKLVPDFRAFDANPDGQIWRMSATGQASYHKKVQDGDLVLCRVNAPLVSECFRFLRQGRKAIIQGRDIGTSLVRTVEKMKADTVEDLITKLDDWASREVRNEQARRNPRENRIANIYDKRDCLLVFCEEAKTVDDVKIRIETIFTNDKEATGIRLSSVHKAKGLEADRVFLLRPKGAEMPHPMAKLPWEVEQEYNLLYVAITRAIKELVYVS